MTNPPAGWLKAIGTGAIMIVAVLAAGCAPQAVGYDLPPEEDQYTFTQDHENMHTVWTFTSSEVTTDDTPEGNLCIGDWWVEETGEDRPCRAEPLIFLRYDAGVGLDNAVPAPGPHTLRVSAYYQAEEHPEIAGLNLSYSTDGGDTWDPVPGLRSSGDGEFTGRVIVPPLNRTNGAVSLQAEAWDADGNRVEQTIEEAYFLRDR